MTGLKTQFILPAVAVVICAVAGYAIDRPLAGIGVGLLAGIAVALLLATSASHRVHRLEVKLAQWGIQNLPGGSERDEIDRANEVLGRFLDQLGRKSDVEQRELERRGELLDRMSDGVMRVDAGGTVIYANRAAEALFGDRELEGKSFVSIVRNHELSTAMRQALGEGQEAQLNFEIYGSSRTGNVVVSRLQQSPAEALVVVRDVTELSRLQVLRRDFVANVSHELRTPLTTIKILTETLIDLNERDGQNQQFLDNIASEVDDMTKLVDDLMELARLESSSGEIEFGAIDARELVDEVERRMAPIAEREGVELRHLLPTDGVEFEGDQRQLSQALANLLHNAITHSPPGATVELAVETSGEDVTFEVRDRGPGIAPEELTRIFERFYQVDRSRTAPGTGLGLAIVKHVARAHGGTVTAESKLGEGSTFRLIVPRSPRNVR